ncbi:M56 family metallopeptidase [Undibacterium pigrum]|uniref:TonB family protein n=1 Tax=Undibacterium pigrum TaxID=401470 RepID=A0A318JF28_9BURK|nr:M56 family metallopeptidase [Undibacterium pigrum]PXX47186.1 TonB family protein [Undibacterium pigrum]
MNEFLPVAVNALGRALLHFIWQGSLVALILALLLSFIGISRIRARYLVSYSALIVCMGIFVREFCLHAFISSSARIAPTLNQAIASQVSISNDISSLSSWLEMHMAMIVIVWLSCVILLALRTCAGLLWIGGFTESNRCEAHPLWQAHVNRMAEQFHIQGKVLLRVVDDLRSPMVVGVFHPMVLMPAAMLTGMPIDLLKMLLAHEMAHIKRHDYLLNLIQTFIEIVLFYHPAVWWMSKQIRNSREEIADDLAARVTGEPRRLALALSELANFQFSTPQLAQAAHGGNLMSRIKRLVKPEASNLNWKAAVAVLGISASCLTLYAQATAPVNTLPSVAAVATIDISQQAMDAAKMVNEKNGDKKPIIDFKDCRPAYPRASIRREETGVVIASTLVAADGKILKAKLEKSAGFPDLDNAVITALENCNVKAVPGQVNGQNTMVWTQVRFVWKLK